MKKNHHLATGHKLAGHYEIIEVLGEDDFEILYLVKDLHLGDNNFVLKELFLTAYASRNDENAVEVMAKSKQGFEQTKKDVIAEIEVLKNGSFVDAPKIYGYFEENDTVYTIMEFVNSSDRSFYLESNAQGSLIEEVVEKEENIEESQTIVEEVMEDKPKSKIFLKILIVTSLLMLGLLFYGYNMMEEDKEKAKNKSGKVTVIHEPTSHPTLENKVKEQIEENLSALLETKEEKSKIPKGASYIEEDDIPVPTVEDLAEVPKAEIYEDTDALNDLEERTYTQEEQKVIEEPIIYEPNISLGTKIN